MASEGDDGTLTRLLRGLAGPFTLIPAKVLVGAIAAVIIGALALAAAGVATDLPVDRPLQWLALLVMAGLALGALGTLVGALAPDGRTALLACLLVSLPLLVLGIVSVRGAGAAVAAAFPFAPAFDGAVALLADADPGDALRRSSLLLGAQALVLGALAVGALHRRRAG
jgi:ABC-type transport system involved in cytochrome c biogenesis permease component